MIKVSQTIRIYEENDKEVPIKIDKYMGVESHWNRDERVILVIDGERITVIAADLEAAISNATNINRF